MNEHFVSIKVDREERPDLDEPLHGRRAALTGAGAGPERLSDRPDVKPFYGGTYFPPERPAVACPGSARLLLGAGRAWQQNRLRSPQAGAKGDQTHLRALGTLTEGARSPAGRGWLTWPADAAGGFDSRTAAWVVLPPNSRSQWSWSLLLAR